MQYGQMLGLVQDRARLTSVGEAARAVWATLEVLATRVTASAARSIAGQLPEPAAAQLLAGLPLDGVDAGGGSFSSAEFIRRVADREGVSPSDAACHVRAVLEVVLDAVGRGR